MLKIQNIDCFYGAIHALKDVSFEVLDKISSGEGKAEETPPKGADTDDQHITAQAPSPVLKKNSRIKPAMIK